MSFGKMNTVIYIYETIKEQDDEGFSVEKDNLIASVRAYREKRHGTIQWANRAAFSKATDLFRIRCIPKIKLSTAMSIVCEGQRLKISSIEDVKGRGMYVEILAEEVNPSG